MMDLLFSLACNAGHYEIVELLLKHNANVNIQSTSGNTALHYSAGGVSGLGEEQLGMTDLPSSRATQILFDFYSHTVLK